MSDTTTGRRIVSFSSTNKVPIVTVGLPRDSDFWLSPSIVAIFWVACPKTAVDENNKIAANADKNTYLMPSLLR